MPLALRTLVAPPASVQPLVRAAPPLGAAAESHAARRRAEAACNAGGMYYSYSNSDARSRRIARYSFTGHRAEPVHHQLRGCTEGGPEKTADSVRAACGVGRANGEGRKRLGPRAGLPTLFIYYLRKVVKERTGYIYPRAMQSAAMAVAVAGGLPLVPPKSS